MAKIGVDLLENSTDGQPILGIVDENTFDEKPTLIGQRFLDERDDEQHKQTLIRKRFLGERDIGEVKPTLIGQRFLDVADDDVAYHLRDSAGTLTYRIMAVTPSLNEEGHLPLQTSDVLSTSPEVAPVASTVLTNTLGAGQFYVIGNPRDVFGPSVTHKTILPKQTSSTAKTITKKPSSNSRPGINGERRDERRRATHNEVERRRRDKINGWISKLGKLLPADSTGCGSASPAGDPHSKGGILAKVYDYINEMKQQDKDLSQCLRENDSLVKQVLRLNHEVSSLKKDNALLRSQLYNKNCSASRTDRPHLNANIS